MWIDYWAFSAVQWLFVGLPAFVSLLAIACG